MDKNRLFFIFNEFICFEFHLTECVHVASEEGDYSYKKVLGVEEPSTTDCGLYILTDPNKIVEISIKYLDANCDTGALLAVSLLTKNTRFSETLD